MFSRNDWQCNGKIVKTKFTIRTGERNAFRDFVHLDRQGRGREKSSLSAASSVMFVWYDLGVCWDWANHLLVEMLFFVQQKLRKRKVRVY